MKEYDIKITETLERNVTVKAESREEALESVRDSYNASEIVLDAEDFSTVEFVYQEEHEIQKAQIETMDVLLVEPGQFPKRVQIGIELEDLQEAVQGGIEVAYPFDDKVGIIVNDEHKLNGMPLNRAIRTEDGEVVDIYAGPFLVVGLTEDDFGSLTPEQMEKFEEMFHTPETFVRMGSSLMILPIPDDMVKPKETVKGMDAKVKNSPDLGEL